MPSSPEASRLRERAATLRRLARRIDGLRLLELHRDVGPDTWVGPTPQHCAHLVEVHRVRLLAAADELYASAARFERQADQFDAAARAPAGAR